MILQVFTVLDKAVGAFLPPFVSRAKGEAVRNFTAAANEKDHLFNKHADDYVLMFLGEFDDSSAIFKCGEPHRILSAREVLIDEDKLFTEENKFPKRLPM